MADRIAVLRDGRIEQIGTPTGLYNQPANRFVAEFVGETNFIDGQVVDCRDGICSVKTAAGVVRASAPAGAIAAGGQATVSVRPESIRIGCDPAGDAANSIPGTLLDTVYLGEFAQYEVQIAGDAVIKVLQQAPKAQPPEPGKKVTLSFEPADAIVLTA